MWRLYLTSQTDPHSPLHNQSLRPPHSAHASTQVWTHNNICSYYNHYKQTHLTRDLIYLSFYIVLQDVWNSYTELFNFNFDYQQTTRCLDCGKYIHEQLHLGRMHTMYYLLCNSTSWRWSSTTETCRCYKLKKIYIICAFCWFFISN
jgi:hypothetical protein